jgi:hypothetical protein
MHIYGLEGSAYYLTYYLPDAYMDYVYPPDFRSKNIEDIWRNMNEYISSVEKAGSAEAGTPTGSSIIIFSPKWEAPFRDYIGVDVKNSPEWHQLESRLAENDVIYSNTFIQIYYLSPR